MGKIFKHGYANVTEALNTFVWGEDLLNLVIKLVAFFTRLFDNNFKIADGVFFERMRIYNVEKFFKEWLVIKVFDGEN